MIFLWRRNKNKFICLVLLLLVISVVGVIMGVFKTPLNDPLNSFQAPQYVPEGYVSVSNNSTASDKAFYYKDNEMNQFMVAAIKDTDKSQLTELEPPLTGMGNMIVVNESMNIHGHDIIFQTLKMDFMGSSMNLFHTSWACDQTGLKIVVIGKMKDNETEKMKKMTQSILCHHEKTKINILGIKI